MTKYISISQQSNELLSNNSVVNKIYNAIIQKEQTGTSPFDLTSNFIGEITLQQPIYKEYIDKINLPENFPLLKINANGGYYILFEDSNVKQIMINHLLTKGIGDGIGITNAQASDVNVSQLPSFANNTQITKFNELSKFTYITSFNNAQFSHCSNLSEIDISNITSLNTRVFQNTNLSSITLNPNITAIPAWCFEFCGNLTTINNTNNIKTIGNAAFSGCTSLQSIDLSSCTSIDGAAFKNCRSLSYIGNTQYLQSISGEAFSGCNNLSSINTINCTNIQRHGLNNCTNLACTLDLSSCTSVKEYSVEYSGITQIINTNNNLVIDMGAFQYCTGLSYIDLSGCSDIKSNAFSQCASLTTIKFGTSIPSIAANTFNGSNNINKIKIPTNMTSDYQTALSDKINNLSNVTFEEYNIE